MPDVVADIRFAARTLRRSPWFTALAVLTVAAGIGGTTALFSLVDAVLLRPLPYKEPHRLVEIWGQNDERSGMRVPGPILEALRARAKTLQHIGTHDPSGGVLRTPDGSIEIRGEAVSANFVEVFGVAPLAGRGFAPDDERRGSPAVMLVSFAFWQQHLGRDPEAVGRPVYLDTVPYTVIGIMPAEFATRFESSRPEFWTPYAGNRSREREREIGYEVVARLSAGVTVEQSRREIEAIAASVPVEGWSGTGRWIGLVPLKEEVVGDRAYALQLMMAAVAVVLAIACANLAQLLLARSDRRLTEFATRKAIGASSAQVFRLALFESLLLAAGGGLCGVALAYWLLPAMVALAPSEIPRLAEAAVDLRVLAMAVTISVVTGCAFGVAPALRLSRLSVLQATKRTTGGAPAQRARLRSVLVVIQVTAAVSLFALAGLVVQTFLTLLPSSPGFATESRAAFFWSIRESVFPDAADRRRRMNQLMQRLEATAGVRAVGVASSIPFGDDDLRNVPIRRADAVGAIAQTTLRTELRAVSSNFLELLRIPLLQGRSFEATDVADGPRVAIVNQTLARRLSPSGNVLGQSVRIGRSETSPVFQIVGVVADTRSIGTSAEVLNEVYTPFAQDRASFGFLIVQSPLDTGALTKAIRTGIYAVMPDLLLPAERRAITLDELIGRSVAAPRFSATLIASFSAMALLLAVIGLFGLVAYSLSQRRQELGIRTALGARPADLIVTSMRSAIVLTAIGIVLGLAAGAYLTRFVESQLYAIEPLDVPTFAGAALVMLVAAGLAGYIPARRAVRSDPMAALRYE